MSVPYVSVAEFAAALTGLDASPTPAQMDDLVRNATGWADEECQQKLMATQDVEDLQIPSRRAVWRPDGSFHITTMFSPIISIDLVELSFDGVNYSPLTWTAKPKTRSSIAVFPSMPSTINWRGQASVWPWLRVTYTDGYPNAFLTTAASAADTHLVVDDPTGIRVGTHLAIYDPTSKTQRFNEQVTVAGNYVLNSTTVPITTSLAFAHAIGVRVSAMPPAIREAVIIAAQEEAKQTGGDVMVRDSSGQAKVLQRQPSQLPRAQKELQRYARVI